MEYSVMSDRLSASMPPCNEEEASDICRTLLLALQRVQENRNSSSSSSNGSPSATSSVSVRKKKELLLFGPDLKFDISFLDASSATLVNFCREVMIRKGREKFLPPDFGQDSYEEAADVWSIGALLFLFLSGKPPLDVSGDPYLVKIVREEGLVDVFSGHWQNVSGAARHLVARLLCSRLQDRISAADALVHEWLCSSSSRGKQPTRAATASSLSYSTNVEEASSSGSSSVDSRRRSSSKDPSGISKSQRREMGLDALALNDGPATPNEASITGTDFQARVQLEVSDSSPSSSVGILEDDGKLKVGEGKSSSRAAARSVDPLLAALSSFNAGSDPELPAGSLRDARPKTPPLPVSPALPPLPNSGSFRRSSSAREHSERITRKVNQPGSTGSSPEQHSSDYAAALASANRQVDRRLLNSLTVRGNPLKKLSFEGGGSTGQVAKVKSGRTAAPGVGMSLDRALNSIDVDDLVPLVEVGDKTVDNLLGGDAQRPEEGSGDRSSEVVEEKEKSVTVDVELPGDEQSMIVDGMGRRLLQSPVTSSHPRRKHGRSSHVFC